MGRILVESGKRPDVNTQRKRLQMATSLLSQSFRVESDADQAALRALSYESQMGFGTEYVYVNANVDGTFGISLDKSTETIGRWSERGYVSMRREIAVFVRVR
jgi:hypothetical protein